MSENAPLSPSRREFIEYLEVPLRRPLYILIPLIVITVGALVASFVVKKKYRSTTLILIETEKVPQSFVRDLATRTERQVLETLTQEMLSRTRLEQVVREMNPYPERMGKDSLTVLVEAMRADILITLPRGKADAFSVAYTHSDPKTAMAVANRLASLFIEETGQAREKQVTEAAQFIDSQLEDARKQLEAKEETLRRYKERHMGNLPDQLSTNLSALTGLQLERQVTAESLRAAKDRYLVLQKNLADQARDPIGTATGRDPQTEMTRLRDQLASLRSRYTEAHPDVQATLANIAQLERKLAAEPVAMPETASTLPTGREQLALVQADVRSLTAKLSDIDQRTATYQQRIERSPANEQEFASLTRDSEKLRDYYLDLLKKKLDAQMAKKLEQRWQGEHFRMLDPASLPERPFFPNRLLFLLGGLFVGLAVGVGVAMGAEFLDHSIKSVRELEAIMPYPVLAVIPHIELQALSATATGPESSGGGFSG